jgi:hypothetical protein
MICPECGCEYREGFTTCADCDVALVDELPPEPPLEEPGDLVTVLETSDPALLLVAKSLLEGAAIPFCAVGERAQDLFGLGRIGAGFNVIVGPVQLQVPEKHEDEALELIRSQATDPSNDAD